MSPLTKKILKIILIIYTILAMGSTFAMGISAMATKTVSLAWFIITILMWVGLYFYVSFLTKHLT